MKGGMPVQVATRGHLLNLLVISFLESLCSESITMPQHLALASNLVELDKLYGMTADAIEVR